MDDWCGGTHESSRIRYGDNEMIRGWKQRPGQRKQRGLSIVEVVMALGVLGVSLGAHFSGQLVIDRSSRGSAEKELALSELSSAMEDCLAQDIESKLVGYPSERFYPDPARADTDWAGAVKYGPRWLMPAYSEGLRARPVSPPASVPGEDRQEIYKSRLATLREQRLFFVYPGLDLTDIPVSPGPDPDFDAPVGLSIMLMAEWVDSRSQRKGSQWDDDGYPTAAFNPDGTDSDPYEMIGADVRKHQFVTYQMGR